MEVTVSPRQVTGVFALAVLGLTLAHLATRIADLALGLGSLHGLGPMFNMAFEGNVPTYFTSLTMVCCATLLIAIGLATRARHAPYALHWIGLGVIFVYLSFDELLQLHERLIEPVRTSLGLSGALFFAWVVPYAVLLGALVVLYAGFLLHLPRRTMWLIVGAGIIYVSGAVGVEMLGAPFYEAIGYEQIRRAPAVLTASPWLTLLQTVEELLEMAGLVAFIYALTSYMSESADGFSLRIVRGMLRARGIS